MKILELDIENLRGIKEKISLKPNGENIVIHGPNGSGKSAVVDAIDFILTGDISRLSGRGTKGISLKDHGKHIDAMAKEAVVKAIIKIDGIEEPITFERSMSKPKELICPEIDEKIFHAALDIANKGQHVLSRAEILKYIAAEAGKRSEEIQAVLNLNTVEEIRKTFVTLKGEAGRIVQTNEANYKTSMASIKTTIGIEEFSEEEVLVKVNECRTTLKGQPLQDLDPEKLQENISPLAQDEKERVNPEILKKILAEINKIIQEKGPEIYETEKELRNTVQMLKEDEKLRRDLASKRLLDLGISLIDETGTCPLCLTKWEPNKLKELLQERRLKAKEAEEIEKRIRDLATKVDTEVTKLKEHLNVIADISKKLKQEYIGKDLKPWIKRLTIWSDNLRQAVEDYPTVDEIKDEIRRFLVHANWHAHCEKLDQIADNLDKLTPEQTAWDTLTALGPILRRYFDEKKKYENSKVFSQKATILSKAYTEAKDRVLEKLFNSVNQDFMEYYKFLHGEDEDGFYAELKPEGSQLDFNVDFYGRGVHHPKALHSEGHQDSMGLCLYLALNKKISEDKIKLIILDDVVMSIDSNHRRNICKLLPQYFPDRQFIITTHNRTWARQLNTDGVVKKQNMVEFKGWSVDTGPKYKDDTDVWGEIKQKLENNEVASAAHQLREHSEYFYESICDSLKAEVSYKSDGKWELGDYLNGAKKAYKKYLKLAKSSANSWNKKEEIEQFTQMETEVEEVIQRSQMEQWGINENVHYSKWGDFTKEDFLPIVEAFQDLEDLFRCPNCQGIIALNMIRQTPSTVKCACGKTFWNLEIKK